MKDRLKELLEKEHLSAKDFALLVDVQQSAVSHLLSGRNKPSMDVIQKIIRVFKHINPTWLLLGEGGMYKSIKPVQGSLFEEKITTDVNFEPTKPQNHQNTGSIVNENAVNQQDTAVSTEKKIIRVVVYFSDNSFAEFNH
jgi:transcriptional regulator with XRE-family HTH domain